MRGEREYLYDILEAVEKIGRHVHGGRPDFEANELNQVWVLHHLQLIGEAARHLSNDTRAQMPDIPWRQVIGMRNALVHGYFDIDTRAVWQVVEDDLSPLRAAVERYLADNPAESDPGAES